MRFLNTVVVLLLLCGPFLSLIPMPEVQAFSPVTAGTVLHTYDTGFDFDITNRFKSVYVGMSSSGNYTVLTVCPTKSNTGTVFATWEITQAGTVTGMLDSYTHPKVYYNYVFAPVRTNSIADWFLCGIGSANDYMISLQIDNDGGIDETSLDSWSASDHSYHGVYVWDDVVAAARAVGGGVYAWRTFRIRLSDGVIQSVGSEWNPGGTFLTDITSAVKTGGYDNTDWARIAWVMPNSTGTAGRIAVAHIYGDDGLHTKGDFYGLVGTANLAYLGDDVADRLQFYSLYDRIHIVTGYASNLTGSGGDADLGVEVLKITNKSITEAEIVTTGTAFFDDSPADSYNCTCLVPISDSAGVYYGDFDIFSRTLHGVTDAPFNQNQLSQRLNVYTDGTSDGLYAYNNSCCRLGTSTMSVFFNCDSVGGSEEGWLITVEHNVPPSVTTDDLDTVAPGELEADGSVTLIGASDVTERGFCYNMIGAPTYSSSRVYVSGTWTIPFSFEEDITLSEELGDCHVRAYACNATGTGYGLELTSFSFPSLSTGTDMLYLYFEPEDSDDDTVQDHSPMDNDMIYDWAPLTFGCASGSVSVDEEAIEIEDSYSRTTDIDERSKVFDVLEPPDTMYQEGTGEGLPLYELFGWTATYLDWGTGMLYMWMMMVTAVGVGVAAAVAAGSPFIGALACGFVLASGMSTGIVPLWLVLAFGIFAATYMLTARSI